MLVLISYRYQYWYQYYRYLDESRKHYNDTRMDKLRKWMDEPLGGIKHRVTRVLPHDVHAMSFKVSMPAMCAFLAQMSIRYACEGHADSKDFPRVYSRFNMSVLNTLK